MLDKIKLLLGLMNDEKDELLNILIALCKDEAVLFCNLKEYSAKLDSTIIEMVIERYNHIGTEGYSSVSSNGITENYFNGYSENTLRRLRKNRRVKSV